MPLGLFSLLEVFIGCTKRFSPYKKPTLKYYKNVSSHSRFIPISTNNPTVASLIWTSSSGVHLPQGKVVQQLGYNHCFFKYDEPIPSNADIIVIQGPNGSLLPFFSQYREIPENEKPILIYWFQQNLYISMPLWLQYFLCVVYSGAYNTFEPNPFFLAFNNLLNKIKPNRGSRFANLGDILWLDRNNLLDILATPASEYQKVFTGFGIDSLLIPRGYHPDYGEIRDLSRDIAVLWMGKIRTERRKRIIHGLREELANESLEMLVYDGVEKPFIFGEERTSLLNRSWFVLNILAYPTDEISIRYYIAAANGAVILTEPGKNTYPFKNRVHLVECPPEQMTETVSYYINHPNEWQRISQNAYNLVSQELTLENSISTMLTQAEKIIINKRSINT